jgi:tetratricopeptide (TPR) repeat protein
MKVYTAKSVARVLDLTVSQVRSYARAGFLEAERGPRGEYRFSFQDLLLLRTAKGLIEARIAAKRVKRALRLLKEQLPEDRPLTGLRISAEGDRVVVRDGHEVWHPDSGQACFNFETDELARLVAPQARAAIAEAFANEGRLTAEDWHELGEELETTAPDHAREAYRRALELDPGHVDTRLNLGRLLHEDGRLHAAEAHYRLALSVSPTEATALFNLGVCLQDQGRTTEAIETYRRTIEADPSCADAHFNLARLYEQAGDSAAALCCLKTYRKLIE